jgi:hypothetical protein
MQRRPSIVVVVAVVLGVASTPLSSLTREPVEKQTTISTLFEIRNKVKERFHLTLSTVAGRKRRNRDAPPSLGTSGTRQCIVVGLEAVLAVANVERNDGGGRCRCSALDSDESPALKEKERGKR